MEDSVPEIVGLNVYQGKVRDEVTAIQTGLESRQGGIRLQALLYTKLTLGVFSDLLGIEPYRLIVPMFVYHPAFWLPPTAFHFPKSSYHPIISVVILLCFLTPV